MLVDLNTNIRRWVRSWTAARRIPWAVVVSLALLIVVGLATPEHDAIRFAGKYLILSYGIVIAVRHAVIPGNPFSKHWWLSAGALGLWIIGFSANYISECLSQSIGKTYHIVHDLSYLYKHVLMLCVAILPPSEEEQPADISFLVVGVMLLAVLHRYALAESSDPFDSGSSFVRLLMCLSFDDLIVVVLIVALCIRLYVTKTAHGKTLYQSLLGCIIVYICASTSYSYGGYTPWFLPTWMQTFIITDAPELTFLLVASLPFIPQEAPARAKRNTVSESLASSVSTALPTVTACLAILVALRPGCLIVGTTVVLVSVCTLTIQFHYKHYHANQKIEAALRLNNQLEQLSLNDVVTGTYNRRWFNETLALGCSGAIEGNPSIVVLMLDVDYFKGYNDALGHTRGDFCLRTVSQAVKDCLHRDRDALARYGGDEFAAILFQTGAAGGTSIAERMRRAVWELNISHPTNPHGRVTVSIGVGVPGAEPNLILPMDLVNAADSALYDSKARGRNTVSLRDTTSTLMEGGEVAKIRTSGGALVQGLRRV